MRVEWSDEQEFLRDAVAGVVAREAQFTIVREWAESGDLAGADTLAARQGWTGIGLDEDLGGQGGGTLELAVLAEQLGRGAVPWDRTLAGVLAAPVLAAAGADELAASTAEGERVAVLAVDARRRSHRSATASRSCSARPAPIEIVVPVASGDEVELRRSPRTPHVRTPRTLVDRTRALADV